MPVLIVLLGVLLLLVLISGFKLNAFISFILVALFVGVCEGMPVLKSIAAIQTGIGNTLSSLVMILGFGAMLGKLVADSGAAQNITSKLVAAFGLKRVQWALMITGFIVGIPMFYSVGFVIMVPLVFTVAASTGLPLLYVGLPMLAALSVTHGYLPPHPAPTAIAAMFSADVGKTLLYGLIVAIPAVLVIIPLFSRWTRRFHSEPLAEFFQTEQLPEDKLPSLGVSLFSALFPVILIGGAAVVRLLAPEGSRVVEIANILGNPALAMLLAVLLSIYTLGLARGKKMSEIMNNLGKGVSSITMVLLVIGGAGALKQIMIESGVSDYLREVLESASLSPLILAWVIAAVIRVCVGSATVAGMTAAGIVLPLVSTGSVSAELMVLSVGAGSIFFSHVNDSGFWLFKEYFNLSIRDTLATWTLMETTVSVVGLIGVLVLNQLV
ncbi:MAG: gluconate:H+ symporter [Bacteroidota bacterium]